MEAFKKLPLVAQLGITLALMVVIAYVGYTVWPSIAELRNTVKARTAQLDELNQQVQQAKVLEKKLPELKRQIANLEEQLNQLKAIIPPERKDSEIVQKFEGLAKRSRLLINRSEARKPIRKDFYDEYPIDVDVGASFHDLAKFFDRLSQLPRIFNVKGVNIVQKLSTTTTVQAKFTAVTFIYRDEPDKPAAAAAPAH